MYIIFPNDPSLSFMNEVLIKLQSYIDDKSVNVISCDPDDASYIEARKTIQSIPLASKIIFIGHSTPSLIYGGMSVDYERKCLIDLASMSVFKDKEIVLVSCFSSKLLTSSRPHRNYSSGIGFGLLPSELGEIDAHNKMNKIGIEEGDITEFCGILSKVIANSVLYWIANDCRLIDVYHYLKILLNREVNEISLSNGNERVSEMLYYVVNESMMD
ncbi:hypothetical protein [Photobacterium phosphoreum]|uniref:hypothetical protein n=1 Tax=Photobacterium phosphoreum TaxID=659 RepID=UPI001E5E8C88|nr:hypothetical protein [Photobacterium phosphoreum]